jgi:hypothetical protein
MRLFIKGNQRSVCHVGSEYYFCWVNSNVDLEAYVGDSSL